MLHRNLLLSSCLYLVEEPEVREPNLKEVSSRNKANRQQEEIIQKPNMIFT